jgi:hypothetical protein
VIAIATSGVLDLSLSGPSAPILISMSTISAQMPSDNPSAVIRLRNEGRYR